jgi:iron complex outermembrane recepter protein
MLKHGKIKCNRLQDFETNQGRRIFMHVLSKKRLGPSLKARLICTAAMLTLSSPVLAQGTLDTSKPETPAAAPAKSTEDSGVVTVTATRTHSTFVAPTPTQSFGQVELQARGATNVSALLAEVPAFGARSGNAASGQRGERAGQNFADLRNLGSTRTLVLIDGRRFVPSVPMNIAANPYQVDLNLIPSLMIQRVDVVTGGASAQYGSDAVAGVTNFILRKQVNGLEGEVQRGVSERGDGGETRIGLVGGLSFHQDRGHLVLAYDDVKNDGIGGPSSRDWSNARIQNFSDPSATLANGLPRSLNAPDVQAGNRTPGGLIVNTSGLSSIASAGLIGTQFNSATSTSAFVRGLYNPATTPTTFAALQSGGGYSGLDNLSMLPSLKRQVAYGRASYDLTDKVTAYLEYSYGKSQGVLIATPTNDQSAVYDPVTHTGSAVRIYADNPYIPAQLRSFIPAPGTPSTITPPAQSFVMNRVNYDFGPRDSITTNKEASIVAGLTGSLEHGWSWDMSYSDGHNDYTRNILGQRNRTLYALATDAVVSPVTGQIVCRSTLTNPNNGCVPVNLFGAGTPSQAALKYFGITTGGLAVYKQKAAQANVRGAPFSTWAGPVAMAAGVEWRNESIKTTVDANSQAGVPDDSIGLAYGGQFSVAEAYVEGVLPIAKDMVFAKSLTFDAAVRHAKYMGDARAARGQTTWKLGSVYQPNDQWLFRVTRSLDIRAPSLYELLLPAVTNALTITAGGVTYGGVAVGSGGNRNLQPEKSNTLTLGSTYRSSIVPGLQLSADYFDIQLEGAIGSVGGPSTAAFCDAGVTSFCSALTYNSGGTLIAIANKYVNLSQIRTSGIDFTTNYRRQIGVGNLSLRGTATYVQRFDVSTPNPTGGAPTVTKYAGGNAIGLTGTYPTVRWKSDVSATYRWGDASVSTNVRYVSSGKFSTTLTDQATATAPAGIKASDNNIPSYYVIGLSGTLNLMPDGRVQLFGVIDNLLDRNPPILPNPTFNTLTNGGLYDIIGRYYRVGLRFKL